MRLARDLLIAAVTTGVTVTVTLVGTAAYFQGQVDSVKDLVGEYAIRETRAAVAQAVDAVVVAETEAREAVGVSLEKAEQAIRETQAESVSAIADAHGIAPDGRAVLEITEYLGRRWCDQASRRRLGQAYRNTGAVPLEVAVTIGAHRVPGQHRCQATVLVDGEIVADDRGVALRIGSWALSHGVPFSCTVGVTIPPGATYEVAGDGAVIAWQELAASSCVGALEHGGIDVCPLSP